VERLKTGAGVIAAVAGAVTGMWTIYEKVKSDTRKITAASYETLAPQLNEMSEALRQLHKENQELRQAMAGVSPEKAQAVVARAAAAGERPPTSGRKPSAKPAAGGGGGSPPTASAGGAAAPGAPPAAPPGQPAPPGTPPAPSPTPTTSPADPGGTPPPAAPPATAQAPPEKADPLSDLLGTVARTREAVDKIRKVPETFDKVLEGRKQ
jgi:hypothetical protein